MPSSVVEKVRKIAATATQVVNARVLGRMRQVPRLGAFKLGAALPEIARAGLKVLRRGRELGSLPGLLYRLILVMVFDYLRVTFTSSLQN